MPSIHTAELSAFRGLQNVKLENCAAVNLLVGANNSGKTTVLEALALLCQPLDIAWWIDTVWSREVKSARTPEREVLKRLFPHHGQSDEQLFAGALKLGASIQASVDPRFETLFEPGETWRLMEAQLREQKLATRDLDYYRLARAGGGPPLPPLELEENKTSLAADLRISVSMGADQNFAVWHQLSEDGALPYPSGRAELRVPCSYVTMVAHRTESLADRLGAAFLKDRRQPLTEMLRGLQPTLETFEAIPKEGQRPQVWLKDSLAGWLPLSVAGDGLRRAFHYAVAAANAGSGVLLIDEIESALHTSALRKVFGFLVRECSALGVQIFATTHSLEALDALLEESVDAADSIAAFVLSKNGPARRLSGEQLINIRSEFGYDIR